MIIRERNPPLGVILLSLAGGLALAGVTVVAVSSSRKKKKEVIPPAPLPGPGPGPTTKPLSYDPKEVRQRLNSLGYTIKIDTTPISGSEETTVTRFQRDWNTVIDYSEVLDNNSIVQQMVGASKLVVDGRPGPAVTSALGKALTLPGQGYTWQQIVNTAQNAL